MMCLFLRTCWSLSQLSCTGLCRRSWPGHSVFMISMATVSSDCCLINEITSKYLGVITMNEMGNVVVAVYELMGIIIKHPPVR